MERDGCCLPAIFQATLCGCIPRCKLGKKRSYLWIMEAGVEENAACCCSPAKCCSPSVGDFVTKVYYDNGPFSPRCGLKKGIATEDDMNYCCWCINCVCCYNMCSKPCVGGVVSTVCVPNEYPCAYKCATRCCMLCCTSPVLTFVKDSGAAKAQLLEAMRASQDRQKAMKGVKNGLAPQPQEMQERL